MSDTCKFCGASIPDQCTTCPKCGAPHTPTTVEEDDSGNIKYWVLTTISLFFPLIGLVLYLVFKNKKPALAKGCGKWAIIGAIINVIFFIFF